MTMLCNHCEEEIEVKHSGDEIHYWCEYCECEVHEPLEVENEDD